MDLKISKLQVGQKDILLKYTIVVLLLFFNSFLSVKVSAQCSNSTSVLSEWNFNTNDKACEGANGKGSVTPILTQNKNVYCPNINNGCGQALLGSISHSNTNNFYGALCLNTFFSGSFQYDPYSTTFDPDWRSNIFIEYKVPVGKSVCLTEF